MSDFTFFFGLILLAVRCLQVLNHQGGRGWYKSAHVDILFGVVGMIKSHCHQDCCALLLLVITKKFGLLFR